MPDLRAWTVGLVLAGSLVAPSAAETLDPWRRGCPDCVEIPVPAGMAEDFAAFERARRLHAKPIALVGPACRRLGGTNDGVEMCVVETATACSSFYLVAARDGTVQLIRFTAFLSGPARCRPTDHVAFRAAVLKAFVRCTSEAAHRRAIRKLFAATVDTTTPAGTARFDREARANNRTGAPVSWGIGRVCGRTGGYRSLLKEQEGILEQITLLPLSVR